MSSAYRFRFTRRYTSTTIRYTDGVNETDARIRRAMSSAMKTTGKRGIDLAAELGVSRSSVNDYLKGRRGVVPGRLLELLDLLELELVVRPKEHNPTARHHN